jgi:hypothetical protein
MKKGSKSPVHDRAIDQSINCGLIKAKPKDVRVSRFPFRTLLRWLLGGLLDFRVVAVMLSGTRPKGE